MSKTYFTPPVVPGRPYALRKDRPYSSLFRFYGSIPAGINLWLLDDGTITTQDPADDTHVTRTFLGAHIHEVDDVEAAALTAAGYGDNLDVVAAGTYDTALYDTAFYG